MLIDEVEIVVEAGHGGAGRVSFFKKGIGPDGGSGGKGGDVYLKATSDLTALNRFSGKKYFKAQDGQNGNSNQKSGRNGNDLTLIVPQGTLVQSEETNEDFELEKADETILICQGGLGGLGNYELRSARNTTPMHAQKGLSGKKKALKLTLRLIADFGLIGLPNAGKSSLLNELTAANAKVGNYAFTTLEPNLGVLKDSRKILADIPGLIEGASSGKGLGIKFLKHIEKVPVLLHCISSESTDPWADYKTIREELGKYNSILLKKKEIILLTKSDMISSDALLEKVSTFKKSRRRVFPVSIHDWDSLEKLRELLR